MSKSGIRARAWRATNAHTRAGNRFSISSIYLDTLERKPGALAGSTPLQRWREAGRWPPGYDQLWGALNERHGKSAGTRLMIELLQAGRQLGYGRLTAAIETALALNCMDAAAVRYLLNQMESP